MTSKGSPSGADDRWRKWRRFALHAVIVVAAFLALRAWQQRGTAAGLAPDLEAPNLQGEVVSLEALRGEPVLVHFWASWCGVCTLMDGTVAALAQDRPVITVASWSGGHAEVEAHLAKEGVRMPVVLDPEGQLAATYGVRALPTSFVVGPDGRIRHTEVGYTSSLGLRLRLWWAGL
jgi:peroxiredoxin